MQSQNLYLFNLWRAIVINDSVDLFEQLVHRYSDKLSSFCLLFVAQKSVAEDIVCNAFVACWAERKRLGNEERIDLYLYKSVKTQSMLHLSNRGLHPAVIVTSDIENHEDDLIRSYPASWPEMICSMVITNAIPVSDVSEILGVSVNDVRLCLRDTAANLITLHMPQLACCAL